MTFSATCVSSVVGDRGENWLDGGDTSTLSNLKREGGKEGKWVSSGTPGAFPVVADKFDLQSSRLDFLNIDVTAAQKSIIRPTEPDLDIGNPS